MQKEELINLFSSFTAQDFFNNVDLHIHTTESDGKLSPEKIIEYVKEKNLKYFSITDHNSIKAYEKENVKNHPQIIYGVEFDCFYQGNIIHILGYGIDLNNQEIQSILAKNKAQTNHNLCRIFHLKNPKEVIEKIHKAGGLAILAHPCCYYTFSLDKFIKNIKDLGIDGVEAYYKYGRLRKYFKFHFEKTVHKIAKKYNLIKTGGTDKHN